MYSVYTVQSKSNLYGVPQGSILGPNLFSIFINDIPKLINYQGISTNTTIYADNVHLLFSGTPNKPEQLKRYAEASVKTIKEWFEN